METEGKLISSTERSERYKIMLLDMWESIRFLEIKLLTYYFSVAGPIENGERTESITISDEERENMNKMLAVAITLWRELTPKVKGKQIEKRFMEFEKDNKEPSGYIKDLDRVFKLTDILREALEELEVTKFEKEMR